MAKKILILGASYGSLLGTKLLMAGHDVTLVCRRATADLINSKGTVVKLKLRDEDSHRAIASGDLPGKVNAVTPEEADPAAYDLVALAMQEPQYGADSIRDLLARTAAARVPCLSIMNMPPLPYLRRIPALRDVPLAQCFTAPEVWDGFDPGLVSLASPDPQAFRPPEEPKNVLQVGLPTNFKAAHFESEEHTRILRDLQADIEASLYDPGDGAIEIPVKLKVHDSIFVPLAKWPMLLAGNYRCIQRDGMISIREAVHGDIEMAKDAYGWAGKLCTNLGAAETDLVPFEKYARAAEGLAKPSSAARALFSGAKYIERVDCLIQRIANQQGLQSDTVDNIVALVDERLGKNRAVTA